MSGIIPNDHYHQINSVLSDNDIEQLLKTTERNDEDSSCLDEDTTFELNQETFYVEVTNKKKCYVDGME
jgi:hypothetical protein